VFWSYPELASAVFYFGGGDTAAANVVHLADELNELEVVKAERSDPELTSTGFAASSGCDQGSESGNSGDGGGIPKRGGGGAG